MDMAGFGHIWSPCKQLQMRENQTYEEDPEAVGTFPWV
jgi:hypothetical protein